MRNLLLSTALVAVLAFEAAAAPRQMFVAPTGNDAWTGRLDVPNKNRTDGPFATLTRARDEIRKIKRNGGLKNGGVVVEMRKGIYEMPQSFALEAQDSGTAQAPVEYRARRGEEVRLVGGKVVTGWKPVSDAGVLSRLDPTARGQVMQTNLRAQGLTDLPDIQGSRSWGQSEPGLELFFGKQPMTLARWPNKGYSTVVDVVGGQPQINRDSTKADKTGVFIYQGDQPLRWAGEYAGGNLESSDEAGAAPSAVLRAMSGVEYKVAQPEAGRWVAEWRIPLAALGLGRAFPIELAANLSVRKTATGQWLMWRDTRGSTWKVGDAGVLRLNAQ
ncbi:hypothetical protein B1R32_12711 [Abditibacterium utsteinense]|uniref:Uncharacterized protein n=1 Tax=Abditibacterium utsteinense TaxID=1960156 RepID=A0A2S8SP92_9BACT|nr:hypothetical protein [Abditibacterium utsteinense]PQV62599.1 hypothetical protein B1R32_12711 [Abditibacterium utsteinense]